MRLRDSDAALVIELGANHVGEIDYLTRIAKPSVAVINNVMGAHLEGFGSEQAIASAKGEIFNGLDEHGIAVINGDDKYAAFWRKTLPAERTVSFGIENTELDFSARKLTLTSRGCFEFELFTSTRQHFCQAVGDGETQCL